MYVSYILIIFFKELWEEDGRSSKAPSEYIARKLSCLFGENKRLQISACTFFLKTICSLASLANSVAWPSRRAPPFSSSEDSAPDHLVELEIQRQHMNVNNRDLPGETQNLCLYKGEAQEGRNPSTASISAAASLSSPPPSLLLL